MTAFSPHQPSRLNPIFVQEERKMIATVDMAKQFANPQIIGRNGELPIMTFLNKYLPTPIRAVTGYFISPSEKISPQIDVIIVDSRYPFLSHNLDGTVLVMLHSVIETIEVKTSLTSRSIKDIRAKNEKITELSLEVFELYGWEGVSTSGFSYGTSLRYNTLIRRFFDSQENPFYPTKLDILRLRSQDVEPDSEFVGAFLFDELQEFSKSSKKKQVKMAGVSMKTLSPLSDCYFRLVQDCLYTLDYRNYSFGDVGRQIMDYMTFGTARDTFQLSPKD